MSQDPGRSEPFHPDGKIDYQHVFDFLRQKNHAEPIGLEYFPSGKIIYEVVFIKYLMHVGIQYY